MSWRPRVFVCVRACVYRVSCAKKKPHVWRVAFGDTTASAITVGQTRAGLEPHHITFLVASFASLVWQPLYTPPVITLSCVIVCVASLRCRAV